MSMPESGPTIVIDDTDFASDIPEYVLTDYENIIQSIPERAKEKFVNQKSIKACFLGLLPEEGMSGSFLGGLTQTEIEETQKALDQTNEMRVVYVKNRPSIINTRAVQRVMDFNKDLFPEDATKDPYTWMKNNPHLWAMTGTNGPIEDIVHTRQGLLSGFRRDSSIKFPQYHKTLKKLDLGKVSGEQKELIIDWFSRDSRVGGKTKFTHSEIVIFIKFIQNQPNLSEYEKEMLIMGHTVTNTFTGYLGFSDSDNKHLEKLQNIYDKSGIDEIAKENDIHVRVLPDLKDEEEDNTEEISVKIL